MPISTLIPQDCCPTLAAYQIANYHNLPMPCSTPCQHVPHMSMLHIKAYISPRDALLAPILVRHPGNILTKLTRWLRGQHSPPLGVPHTCSRVAYQPTNPTAYYPPAYHHLTSLSLPFCLSPPYCLSPPHCLSLSCPPLALPISWPNTASKPT